MFLRTKRFERGAAAVEMALMLPVLFLFIGGIIDFGRAYFTQVTLANAAREGARAAIVLAVDPAARANAAMTGIPALDQEPPDFTPTTGCAQVGLAPPPEVTVKASASFRYIFLGYIPGITNPTTLSSTAVMGC